MREYAKVVQCNFSMRVFVYIAYMCVIGTYAHICSTSAWVIVSVLISIFDQKIIYLWDLFSTFNEL